MGLGLVAASTGEESACGLQAVKAFIDEHRGAYPPHDRTTCRVLRDRFWPVLRRVMSGTSFSTLLATSSYVGTRGGDPSLLMWLSLAIEGRCFWAISTSPLIPLNLSVTRGKRHITDESDCLKRRGDVEKAHIRH